MNRGVGYIFAANPTATAAAPDQWTYVIYGILALCVAMFALWMIMRYLSSVSGESAANESRARLLLERIGNERNLRIATHWRPCPNGTMRWEVDAVDERTGQRWVTTERRLLEATHALAQELELPLDAIA